MKNLFDINNPLDIDNPNISVQYKLRNTVSNSTRGLLKAAKAT